jgi:chaperonin GroES
MKIKPVEDRVLVECHEVDAEVNGFYEHSKTTERPKSGTIVAVGPGRYLLDDGKFVVTPMPVKEGDTIYFGRNIGTEMVVDGKSYLIMRLSEAYATE